MTKELPTNFRGRWWGNEHEPSQRLIDEVLSMKTLFDVDYPIKRDLPKTSWDVTSIVISTKFIDAGSLKALSSSFDYRFHIEFSMNDRSHICKSADIWTMDIFCPNTYPDNKPEISIAGLSGEHILNPIWVGGKAYPLVCIHRYHDPAHDTCVTYASHGICFLRAKLTALKHRTSMDNYTYENKSWK